LSKLERSTKHYADAATFDAATDPKHDDEMTERRRAALDYCGRPYGALRHQTRSSDEPYANATGSFAPTSTV
jgi:hypothetical protein